METTKKSLIIATITSKNQITIPKAIRQKLDVHTNDQLSFEETAEGEIVIKKKANDDFWQVVKEHSETYTIPSESEIDWGSDLGGEVIDE
ncbi:type II toxin-antitoxin system PrlF family antitoxin [Enterococcus diestrammenae]|uniref:type II toxin-antitoxin system PrlF family antitoxin n=1 Tax=Enterococcus diestrammenae TaxID=1155073 RepID=UPI00195615F4